MKIALHGSYFGDNFGDTLFSIMFKEFIQSANKTSDVYFPFASERVRYFTGSKKPSFKKIFFPDRVVYFGGGYLGQPTQKSSIWSVRLCIRHLLLMTYYLIIGVPYKFYSVGAGPLDNKFIRLWVKVIINKSQGIYVRDKKSFNFLNKIGVKMNLVHLSTDWVLNLKSDVKKKSSKKIRIGVHLPSLKISLHYKNAIDELHDFVNTNQSNYEITYFKDFFKENFNDQSYEYFVSKNFKHEYINYKSPKQLRDHISELDILISNKLHCCIVACSYDVSVISVGVHEKTKRFFEQINYTSNNRLLSEDYNYFVRDCLNPIQKPVIPKFCYDALEEMKKNLTIFVNS